MDRNTVRQIIIESTKSLTVHDVEVVEVSKTSLHFRIIAEAYASQGKAQRVLTVLNLIEKNDPSFSDKFLFSVDPFTPEEFGQFYQRPGNDSTGPATPTGEAAKPAEA